MSRRLRIGSIIVMALLLVGAISFTAFAQTSSNEGGDKFNEAYQTFVSKLATNLGMDQDKVKSALEATQKQMLDEAVKQGKFTQAQADKIGQKKNGFGFGPRGFGERGFRGHGFGKRGFGHNPDAIASILGITSDQLKKEIDSGKKLDQIITGHGMTMEQFKQKMLDSQKEKIKQAVSSSQLTQAQADEMLQRLEKRMENPSPQRTIIIR